MIKRTLVLCCLIFAATAAKPQTARPPGWVVGWGYSRSGAATGQVNIVVGDTNLCPNRQTVLTGTHQPLSLRLTA
jgi:hypothetical protein